MIQHLELPAKLDEYLHEVEPKLNGFYVYILKKPNGDIFYIGKGHGRRAFDFSPSRRTKHFLNIINKYGRENIIIEQIPCMYEAEAFRIEKMHIRLNREYGKGGLINLTDGGEGASGRKPSVKQLIGLSKGRSKEHYQRMSEESKQRVLNGLVRGREKCKNGWQKTNRFKELVKNLGRMGIIARSKGHEITCIECGELVIVKSYKAKNCSRKCEQRSRRKRQKNVS